MFNWNIFFAIRTPRSGLCYFNLKWMRMRICTPSVNFETKQNKKLYLYRQTFDEFKTRHGKTYQNSLEEGRRMEVFRQNMRYIHSKNRSNTFFLPWYPNWLTAHLSLGLLYSWNRRKQCWGSVTFWCGSGSADPYLNNGSGSNSGSDSVLQWL